MTFNQRKITMTAESGNLPPLFLAQMKDLLGEEFESFIESMGEHPPVSMRLNTRKKIASCLPSCLEELEPEQVKWCRNGFYLKERPVFTLDPLFHAGVYYVQEASSMIYEPVTEFIVKTLTEEYKEANGVNGETTFNVLDLCASPGGKTTAMINALPDGSLVTANEFIRKRYEILRENLIKWGYPSVDVTNLSTDRFAVQGEIYDIVAVDAPCSGEGMMRKEKEAVRQWSIDLIEECVGLQRKIIDNAVEALKPGGFLIYSTCTFNRHENEENAEYLHTHHELEPVNVAFPPEWNIMPGISTDLPVMRFMPHKTKGEGLFIALFRKPGKWISSPVKKFFDYKKAMKVKEEPDISDILSCSREKDLYPEIDLDKETALKYLRREAIILPPDVPKGYVIVRYKGMPLGAVKNIGSRANNLYPKQWRILMR